MAFTHKASVTPEAQTCEHRMHFQRVCTAIFGWAGHVARRTGEIVGPSCWLEWKNRRWYEGCRALQGEFPGERRRCPTTNWARQIEFYLYSWNSDWESQAQNRDRWTEHRSSWLEFCMQRWRFPQIVKSRFNPKEGKVQKPNLLADRLRIMQLAEQVLERRSRKRRRAS